MEWSKLLNEERERISATKDKHRNGFDKDYDRIIPSSSLRRLNDKTQVFPLQTNDFTRTRLTHSLEVSAIGRSLGLLVADKLFDAGKINTEVKERIPSALAVASLVHDIGNPPFGHYGEDIIRNWFSKWFSSEKYCTLVQHSEKNRLSNIQKSDFENWEGNAQGLRILTKLQFLNDHHGINFTYGSLGTLIKYPCSSAEIGKDKLYTKFGYFQSEKGVYDKIQEKTGTNNKKHPLSFLLKASDEIAYLAADIEDGVKKGLINWDEVYEKNFKDVLEKDYSDIFRYLERYRKTALDKEVPDRRLIDVQNFRIMIQGAMVNDVADEFMEKYGSIMNGEYNKGLLATSKSMVLQEKLSNIGLSYCYSCKEVLNLELVGDTVINGLLDAFVNDIAFDEGTFKLKTRAGKLYNRISPNFRYIYHLDCDGNYLDEKSDELDLYRKLQLITDFISGMTDSYAVDLYQNLKGFKLS